MQLIDDLATEQAELEVVLTALEADHWSLPTPSEGWTVAHQVAHLAWFDRAAARSISRPADFVSERDALVERAMGGESLDDLTISGMVGLQPTDLLAEWREGRIELADAAEDLEGTERIEWFGPSMSARSFLTARLMEVWAHGQDIVDALDAAGVPHPARRPGEQLRHIAHLGYVTRGWSYAVRGEEAPDGEVAVRLVSPAGETWTWGPERAAASITGPAIDFCAVVTQRRNVADTSLVLVGDDARTWMAHAQAFAGGSTSGPEPGSAAPVS